MGFPRVQTHLHKGTCSVKNKSHFLRQWNEMRTDELSAKHN